MNSEQRMSRRAMLRLGVTVTGATLLAACTAPAVPVATTTATSAAKPATTTAGGAATSTAAPAGSSAAAAETPRTGGVLRWGQVGDLVSNDANRWAPDSEETTGAVAEQLTTYTDDLKPVPRLAESWDISSDGTRIKLNLRKGVTFHSGREFTSEDVKYNILRVRDPSNPQVSVVAPGSKWWTTIETPDKHTIILTSDEPRPGMFDWLQYLRIGDRDIIEGPDGHTKVGGTGPFKWVEWRQGESIHMVKNPDYWDTGHPYVDEYLVTIFADQQAMMTALEAGTLDVAALAPVPDAVRLKNDPQYQVLADNNLGQFFHVSANTVVPPTDNKLVRQAIGYAIDRKRFTEQIMKGFVGEPKDLPWTSSSPAFEAAKNQHYTYDLNKAKSLLAQSGVSDPEFDITWALAGFSAEYANLAQILQSDLAKIGIKTNLKPLDPAVYTATGAPDRPTFSGVRLSAGAFAGLYEAASEFALSRTMGYASNAMGFYDDRFTALVKTASTEPDAAKRKALYAQINDFLLEDAAYCFPICAYVNLMVARANVRGLRHEPSTQVTLRNMWLA